MNEIKQTMSLVDFEKYCYDICSYLSDGYRDFNEASEIKSGKVMVDITYRIIREPEQLELDFGEQL